MMRFCLRAVPILALLTSLASSPSETVAQPSDPAAVVKTFNDALNAGDGATALAQFADDAVVRTPGGSVFNGRDEIGRYAAGLIAQHYRADVDPRSVQVVGDRVTSRGQVALDDWRKLGLTSLESIAEAVVRNGKIVSITATLTPESLARLQAAQTGAPVPPPPHVDPPAPPPGRAPPAQLPRSLPRTGALPDTGPGLLAGAALLCLGLLLRRVRRTPA